MLKMRQKQEIICIKQGKEAKVTWRNSISNKSNQYTKNSL